MQNFIKFYTEYFACCKKVAFGGWGLKTIFQASNSYKATTLIPIFTNKYSFHPESREKSNEHLKY